MTEWTWMPTEHLHPLDHHACSSPRADIKLGPATVNRQLSQHKRKRSESLESVTKKRKCAGDGELSNEVGNYGQPISAARLASTTNVVPRTAVESRPSKDDRRDSMLTQSGAQSFLITGDADDVHAVPAFEGLQRHDSCMTSPPRLSVIAVPDPLTTLSQTDHASDTLQQNRTVDRIESQLNLQILSKHDELRLIETEIGKAQIMLEQLRRVRIIPYPGHDSLPLSVDNMMTGGGLSLKSEPGTSQPQHAPPFGATDSPYSRHYEQWLIPDEAFDPSPARTSRNVTSAPAPVMRKKSSLDDQTPARQPKRISTSQIVQLPTVTISVDGSPLLVVQREDGEWVKVVCQKCGKQNAANLQGFTNHTRIAHSITYANHKEAIKECGQTLDDHEAAQVSSAVSAQLSLTPSLPTSAVQARAGRSSVHPLIFGESVRQSKAAQRTVNSLSRSDWRHSLPATPTSASSPVSATSSSFIASPDTPHLSRKLAGLGSSMNLHQLVTASKMRIDLDQVQPLIPDIPDIAETPTPTSAIAASPSTNHVTGQPRMPAREVNAFSENEDSEPNGQLASVGQSGAYRGPPHASNTQGPAIFVPVSSSTKASVATSASFDFAEEGGVSRSPSGQELEMDDFSPNHSPTTVDTNPGMVSDHDDDSDYLHHSEHGDDAERTREDAFMHVRVRGEHGDEDELMHDYHEVHTGTPCTSGPSYADSVFFADEQRHAPQPQMDANMSHDLATPPSQKKKRGRPRKTDTPAPLSH